MNLFNPDSKFMIITNTILDYVKIGLLFMLFSIPIITTGAAAAAALHVGMKIERGEAPAVWKPFLDGFKSNFKQGTIVTLIALFLGVILAFDWYQIFQMETTVMIRVVRATTFIVILFLAIVLFYMFSLMARYELTIRQMVHNAIIYTVSNMAKNLLAVLILLLGFILYSYVKEIIPIVIFVFPGLEIWYFSKVCVKSFNRLERSKESEMDEM